MLKVLKNENYKKIWEAVIKNRHPEAESLEDALRNEVKYGNCLYSFDVNSRGISMCNDKLDDMTNFINTYNTMRILCGEYSKKYSTIKNFTINLQKDLILGRPITLEDILNLFANLENEGKISIDDISITRKNTLILSKSKNKRFDNNCAYVQITKYLEEEDEDGEDEKIIDFYFELTKPLHEQTDETWEAIANLI